VVVRRSDTGATATLHRGSHAVEVTGLPSEIVLLLYGRRETRGLVLDGPKEQVARLRWSDLGI
jgi:hypothetical protein